jgi:hypothetical protein
MNWTGWGLPSSLAGPHFSIRWYYGWPGNHACVLTRDLQPACSNCVCHAAFSRFFAWLQSPCTEDGRVAPCIGAFD